MGSDDIKRRKIVENREMRQARKLGRKTQSRTSIPRILILTEGLTEEIYFKALKKNLKLNSVEVLKSSYTDSNGIVQDAKSKGIKSIDNYDEYNYIFCVFDLDTVRDKQFLASIESYNAKYEKSNSIIYPILTFPCIEFWFILHYYCHSAPFSTSRNRSVGENTKVEFKKYQGNYHETNYECIGELASKYKTALHNAKVLMDQQINCSSSNPITNIHQLVTLLHNIYSRTQDYQYQKDLDTFILNNIN